MELIEKNIKLNINEIKSYEFPMDEVFNLEINYDNITFCFIIRFSSKNKKLLCFGPGAHLRNQKTSQGKLIKPPFFDRWSWYQFFDESFIAYADPTFFYNERITIGWFVGNKKNWYIEIISKIIKKLSENQNITHNNILFFGSSGGGFSSVCLGTLIPNSKVLINNSQLFIMNYHEWHVNNVLNLLKKDFPNLHNTDIAKKIYYRLDVTELFKKENYMPNITYYVNIESTTDINNHCLPFINKIAKLNCFNECLNIIFYKEQKEVPHEPMSSEKTIEIIKSFIKKNLNNDE